jgi:molybdopterin converting factor small subunit
MKINILLFGQLVDITGTDKMMRENMIDTDALVNSLHQTYPALSQSKYLIAVDKKIIEINTLLTDHCTVALLPPFSGG